jgi:hypothetical protein
MWYSICNGRAVLGRNFDVKNGKDAKEACFATCNLGSYQLSMYSKSDENYGEHRLMWPVTGPCGYKLPAIRHSGCFASKLLQMCVHRSFFRIYSYGRVTHSFITQTGKSVVSHAYQFLSGLLSKNFKPRILRPLTMWTRFFERSIAFKTPVHTSQTEFTLPFKKR